MFIRTQQPHIALFSLRWMLDHDRFGVLKLWIPIQFVISHARIATYLMLLIVCFLSPFWILPPCLLLGCIAWLLEEFRAKRSDSLLVQASDLETY